MSAVAPQVTSTGRMFARAFVAACPRCGSRRTFIRRWLGKYPRCRSCGIRWRREEGFELGPVALNTVVTFFTLAAAMTVAFVRTSPDIPVMPLVLTFGVVAVVMPLVLYPLTFTVWLAFDLAATPPDADETADALAWVASQGDSAA